MLRSRALLPAVAIVDVVLFMLSGIPRFRDAKSGVDVAVGDVIWFGFLAGLLTVLMLTAVVLTRRFRLRHQGEIR
jgi:hypothetical protein